MNITNITLDYGSLYDIVARSLSVIGKRANDDKGNNIFGSITLGSAEKKIVCDFFNNAFTELCATLQKFITSEIRQTGTDNIDLVVTTPDNWNTSLQLSLRQALTNYCVSYALYSWFTVTAPHISQKYQQDSQRQLLSIMDMIHEKNPSQESPASYNDINGTSN